MSHSLPPAAVLFLAAALVPLCRGHAPVRGLVLLLAPLAALALIWTLPDGNALAFEYLGLPLVVLRVDALGRLFATIFAIMAFAGVLYSLNQRSTTELAAACVYAGSAIGVALAGDLITLLVFWELMALASTAVIWSARTPSSFRAAGRYLMIHLLGGTILMIGVVGHLLTTGSVAFNAMPDGAGSLLILVGFLINAAAWPISAWLPDAYPEASWSGTVFLSAFTTKAAVYALLRGFPGAEILVPIGLVMIFYGIIYALLENDMRRILAYSIVNQVGFMVVGIGIGTELSLNGAAAHAFAHIIYKALLLMSAGSVLLMTGRRKCSELGGLFQSMPLTTLCGIVGALSISAFPLTSGFVTKSMINQAAGDQGLSIAWLLLTAGSAGVFLHAGIKFPWFVFFQKDSGLRPPDPPWNMRALHRAARAGDAAAPRLLRARLLRPVAADEADRDHQPRYRLALPHAAAGDRGDRNPRRRAGGRLGPPPGDDQRLAAHRPALAPHRPGRRGRAHAHRRQHGGLGDPDAGGLPRRLLPDAVAPPAVRRGRRVRGSRVLKSPTTG